MAYPSESGRLEALEGISDYGGIHTHSFESCIEGSRLQNRASHVKQSRSINLIELYLSAVSKLEIKCCAPRPRKAKMGSAKVNSHEYEWLL